MKPIETICTGIAIAVVCLLVFVFGYKFGKINAQYDAVRNGHGRYVTNYYPVVKTVTNTVVSTVITTNEYVQFEWNNPK